MEYARNVLNLPDADHEEISPNASTLIIQRLNCSLAGQMQTIRLVSGSIVHHAYGNDVATEEFRCNFGLNPSYQELISGESLSIVGVDQDEEIRAVELKNHRFFVSTLFLPQLSSSYETPHPLIIAYLKSARAFHDSRSACQI